MVRRTSACAALFGVVALCGQTAAPQPMLHPILPTLEERPLHQRLALADAVVTGRVESVEMGRIRVVDVQPIVGRTGDAFELKRAPSNPPPLAPGDRALLLLRGVRSPYLLVDEPGEVVEIDGDLAHWPPALRALHSASGRPAELAALYASWLEHDSAELRRAALIGLGEPGSTLSPPESSGERLAELAVDPDLRSPLRLRAASGALRTDGGRRALLQALPGGAGADARVLATGVRAALRGGADARAVLMRSLDHESPEIRRTGARLCALIAQDEELRERLGELARSDPDAGVRQAAMRAMGVG